MKCGHNIERLVETARGPGDPDAALRAHLSVCPQCTDRWETERALTADLRTLRIGASARRSPEAARESLMRQFATRRPTPIHTGWVSMAVAAVLLLGVVLGQHAMRRPAHVPAPALAESADESFDAQEGFIAVPYVPPLAMGETVSIVHTQLYPAALASLGVNVDPAWTTELPADLLVGEDGFPRAVRVADDYSNSGGF